MARISLPYQLLAIDGTSSDPQLFVAIPRLINPTARIKKLHELSISLYINTHTKSEFILVIIWQCKHMRIHIHPKLDLHEAHRIFEHATDDIINTMRVFANVWPDIDEGAQVRAIAEGDSTTIDNMERFILMQTLTLNDFDTAIALATPPEDLFYVLIETNGESWRIVRMTRSIATAIEMEAIVERDILHDRYLAVLPTGISIELLRRTHPRRFDFAFAANGTPPTSIAESLSIVHPNTRCCHRTKCHLM